VERCATSEDFFKGDGDRLRELWTSGWTEKAVPA
jgi:hypothetical protein